MNEDTKTALITRSGQNIGRGIAHHLAAASFNITANGSSNQEAATEQIVQASLDQFGAIDL